MMSEDLSTLTSKFGRALGSLTYLPRAFKLVWAAAPEWTALWAILLLAQGLLPVVTVYLTGPLVNSLVAAVGSGATWEDIRPVLILVGLMAGIMVLTELFSSVARWVRTAQSQLLQDHISSLIHQKSVAADMAFYESPDYYDHLHRARVEANYRPQALLDGIGSLLQNSLTLAAMLVVLLPFGFWLPFALLVSTLPAFYVVVRYAVRQHHWRLRTTEDERRSWYYDWLLTAGETAAELRLFGLGSHFQGVYRNLRRRLRKQQLQLAWHESFAELGAGASALVITGATMAWMVWQAIRGLVTLGDLALFYQAFNQGQRLMRSSLASVGQLYSNCLFLGNLFEFLDLESKVIDSSHAVGAPVILQRGVRFRQITFCYPGTSRAALRDFNLEITAGQIVAIVGPNGAGKSTLIKLLCRLYDPDTGSIEMDGTDLRNLQTEDLRRRTTVLFQEPVRYNDSVIENISLGNRSANLDHTAIVAAARAAGADTIISHLPEGYASILGKTFSKGTDLSVGEWQRIALARAFLRRAPIILLDEPTSAMDSWSEAEWVERFRSLAAGRTVIMITHRFTTAMRADIIHVMDEGQIVESGCHDELLALGGSYAQSWRAQLRQVDGNGNGHESRRTENRIGTETELTTR
jgi:ATP-binding cassette, subfamily B, bacterial